MVRRVLIMMVALSGLTVGCAKSPEQGGAFAFQVRFEPETTYQHHQESRTSIDGVWRPTDRVQMERVVLEGGVAGREPLRWIDRVRMDEPSMNGIELELTLSPDYKVKLESATGGDPDMRALFAGLHVAQLQRAQDPGVPKQVKLGDTWGGKSIEVPIVGQVTPTIGVASVSGGQATIEIRAAGEDFEMTGSHLYDIERQMIVRTETFVTMKAMGMSLVQHSLETVESQPTSSSDLSTEHAVMPRIPQISPTWTFGSDAHYAADVVEVLPRDDGAWIVTTTDLRWLDETGVRIVRETPCRARDAIAVPDRPWLYVECSAQDDPYNRRGRLIDPNTGDLIAEFDAGNSPGGVQPRAIAVAPRKGGHLVLAAHGDGGLTAIEVTESGSKATHRWLSESDEVMGIAPAPDGTRALVALREALVVAPLDGSAPTHRIEGRFHLGGWLGDQFVAVHEDDQMDLALWRVSGEEATRVSKHTLVAEQVDLRVGRDGARWGLSASPEGQPASLFAAEVVPIAGEAPSSMSLGAWGEGGGAPGAMHISPDGLHAAALGRFGVTAKWIPTTGAWPDCEGHCEPIIAHSRLPGGRTLSLDLGGRLVVWSESGAVVRRDEFGGSTVGRVDRWDFVLTPVSADTAFVATPSGRWLVDVESGARTEVPAPWSDAVVVVRASDADVVLTLPDDGRRAERWSAAAPTAPKRLGGLSSTDEAWPGGEACAAALSADGQRYALFSETSYVGGEAAVYSADGTHLMSASGGDCEIALSADGRRLAIREDRAEIHVYEVDSGERIAAIRLYTELFENGLRDLALNADGSLLAGVHRGKIHLYDVDEPTGDAKAIIPLGVGADAQALQFRDADLWWAEITRIRGAEDVANPPSP